MPAEKGARDERFLCFLACAVIFLGTVGPANFEQVALVQVLVAGGSLVTLGLLFARKVGPKFTLAFVAVAGIAFRLTGNAQTSSDVARATMEALSTLASGANPYTHHYITTNPPGSPFVYLPGELAFYGIQSILPGGLALFDRWWGILTLLAILGLAPACGYGRAAVAGALYAIDTIALWRSIDGSNDTALAFLCALSIAALLYGILSSRTERPRTASGLHDASAAILGWALAFKALSWPIAPFLVLCVAPQRRLRYGLIAGGVLALFCLPFAIASPGAFFGAIALLDAAHANVWGFNLWAALLNQHLVAPGDLAWPLRLRYAVILLVVVLVWRRASTVGLAVLQGALVIGAALLVAPWSSSSYYAYLAVLVIVAVATLGIRVEESAS